MDDVVSIAPGFPEDWEHADLTLKDLSLHYTRRGNQEIFNIWCDRSLKKRIRVLMRAADMEVVLVDGQPVPYEIAAGANNSFLYVETDKVGAFQLRVSHGKRPVPTVRVPETVLAGHELSFEISGGTLKEVMDISETLEDITIAGNQIYAKAKDIAGHHTLFLRVTVGKYDAWLAADYEIVNRSIPEEPLKEKPFTPAEKENLACVSLFDVFPTSLTFPLSGKGQEVAVMFIASTNCMQSYVENARITVTYADGATEETSLVYPFNIDDWLTSALTTKAECFYFSNFNHATVQRVRIDPAKELADIKVEAIANEVILGVAGISISR